MYITFYIIGFVNFSCQVTVLNTSAMTHGSGGRRRSCKVEGFYFDRGNLRVRGAGGVGSRGWKGER